MERQITTHRIFPVEQTEGDLQYGIELVVTSPVATRGETIQHDYTPVLIDTAKLDNIEEQHDENVASDDDTKRPLYLDESVLAHNLDDDDLDDLVCARGGGTGFNVADCESAKLKALQEALMYASDSGISPREAECQFYKSEGYARREIASILGIGFTTVKSHLSRSKQTMDSVDDELQKWKATKTFAEVIGFRDAQ